MAFYRENEIFFKSLSPLQLARPVAICSEKPLLPLLLCCSAALLRCCSARLTLAWPTRDQLARNRHWCWRVHCHVDHPWRTRHCCWRVAFILEILLEQTHPGNLFVKPALLGQFAVFLAFPFPGIFLFPFPFLITMLALLL
ncbi:hypothetical protein JHK82_042235 [Glycine max]|nr:hypothetical protein JHK85_042901 [Glycine max]KAG5105265.1 hypothetical protein JHK82_042235 [Glycine max]KHN14273.1 hypothetical protein glysoja_012311 [Glycine soja]